MSVERPSPEAERAYADALSRLAPDDEFDIDGLCRDHPEHASALRLLHDNWIVVQGLIGAVHESASTFDETHVGAEALRTMPGSHSGSGSGFASEILKRLAPRTGAFERYRIEGEVARGGQGVVLRVWDEDLRRPLAMKLILGRGDAKKTGDTSEVDQKTLGRFLEEAQVTGQLDHPGIVPVHELGLDSEGRVYFTMKLVKGEDLKAVFDKVHTGEDGWNLTRALGVLQKTCEAMAYAHAKGVLHRDLKPGNVMVGRFGEVYVMDWGLARVLGKDDPKDIRIQPQATTTIFRSARRDAASDTPDSPLVTMDGDVIGTPAYMSPEQAAGHADDVGPQSDVYSLGAMLYHLLTGQMPFVPPGGAYNNYAVLLRVQEGPPRPVHELSRGAPEELQAICQRAMVRKPEGRYPSTVELADDLRAYLEGRVVLAHRTGAIVELKKWVARNRGMAGWMAAAVLLFVVGTAALVSERIKLARSNEVLARTNVELDSARGAAVDNAEEADRQRTAVMRLSGFQVLEDLREEVDELWPAHPGLIPSYEDWIARADDLVAGLDPDPAIEDIGYLEQLDLIAKRALAMTDEERERARVAHPLSSELARLSKQLAALRRSRDVRDGRAVPAAFELDATEVLPSAPVASTRAFPKVSLYRREFGDETEGLALAQRALELPPEGQHANAMNVLALALHANGLDEEAIATSLEALAVAPEGQRPVFEAWHTELEGAIAATRGASGKLAIAELQEEVAVLVARIEARHEREFADEEDRWWFNSLGKLIGELEAFGHEETGLAGSGVSPEFGWSIRRRLEEARAVRDRMEAAETRDLWAGAIQSISDEEECPEYRGLVITEQTGFVPIGRDPYSGLWEFAYLLSGDVPERNENGELILTDDTGIVFVLVCGGTFLMGAQSTDPRAPNYDPRALAWESPPHEVSLWPYLLSKYEMTQGQWLRFTGSNPSQHSAIKLHVLSMLHPVERVSWTDCDRTLRRLGLELPTEAQWEYGARGGTTTAWWTGDDREALALERAANLADQAARRAGYNWSDLVHWPDLDDGWVLHAPVNECTPNPYGLHGIVGNVYEPCADWYGLYSLYGVEPGTGLRLATERSNRTRASRGSGFNGRANSGRSTARSVAAPERLGHSVGVRPAKTLRE